MIADQPTPPLTEPKKPSTLFWVTLTVSVFFVSLFILSTIRLIVVADSSQNKFTALALEEHRAFLLRENAHLFLAYVGTIIGFTLLIYPAIRWLLFDKKIVTRWRIIWPTLLIIVLITLWSWLRLIEMRPYFLVKDNYKAWYFQWSSELPEALKSKVYFALFQLLPGMVLMATVAFYLYHFLTLLRKNWSDQKRLVTSVSTVVFFSACWLFNPSSDAQVKSTQKKPATPSSPNILILASDSLRGDRLSCNGYQRQTSPHIDALARESVNFTRALTPIASTLESMTTMFTGQYPHTHGLQHMYPSREQITKVAQTAPTLADSLRRRGYRTTIMGDWCAGVFHVNPLGFEEIDASSFDNFRLYISQTVFLSHSVMPLYFDNRLGYSLFPQLKSFASFVTPEVVTERVLKKLNEATETTQPFFITAFYSCTHIPYYCPPPYHQKFSHPAYNGPNKYRMDFDVDAFVCGAGIDDKFRALPPEEIQQIRDLYDGTVSFFDDQVGQIMAHLKKTGLLDNTIVLVTSDHGDDLFEPNTTFSHGLSFNGGDQTNHVPCLIRLPHQAHAGRRIDQIVRTIDIAPTLLELTNSPIDTRFEGCSLVPYITGESENLNLAFYGETSYLFFKRQIPGEEPLAIAPLEDTTFIDPHFDYHFVLKKSYEDDVIRSKERCIRTEHWKLVFTPGQYHDIWRLYDLKRDPHCTQDVKYQNLSTWKALESALRTWAEEKKSLTVKDIFPSGEPTAISL